MSDFVVVFREPLTALPTCCRAVVVCLSAASCPGRWQVWWILFYFHALHAYKIYKLNPVLFDSSLGSLYTTRSVWYLGYSLTR